MQARLEKDVHFPLNTDDQTIYSLLTSLLIWSIFPQLPNKNVVRGDIQIFNKFNYMYTLNKYVLYHSCLFTYGHFIVAIHTGQAWLTLCESILTTSNCCLLLHAFGTELKEEFTEHLSGTEILDNFEDLISALLTKWGPPLSWFFPSLFNLDYIPYTSQALFFKWVTTAEVATPPAPEGSDMLDASAPNLGQ